MEGKDLYEGHSPAQGIAEGVDSGSTSQPAPPSVHPENDLCGDGNLYDDTPTGNKDVEAFAGVSATPGINQVQLADGVPTEYADAGLGETLVGGLGNPPRP